MKLGSMVALEDYEALRAALREAEDTRRIQDDALLKVSKAWREQWRRAEALAAALREQGGVRFGVWHIVGCALRTRPSLPCSERCHIARRALAGEPRAEGRR